MILLNIDNLQYHNNYYTHITIAKLKQLEAEFEQFNVIEKAADCQRLASCIYAYGGTAASN